MSAPFTRKRTGLETFVDRRAKKRRRGLTVSAIEVKFHITADDFLSDDIVKAVREIIREEIDSDRLMHSGCSREELPRRAELLKADRQTWLNYSNLMEAPHA